MGSWGADGRCRDQPGSVGHWHWTVAMGRPGTVGQRLRDADADLGQTWVTWADALRSAALPVPGSSPAARAFGAPQDLKIFDKFNLTVNC